MYKYRKLRKKERGRKAVRASPAEKTDAVGMPRLSLPWLQRRERGPWLNGFSLDVDIAAHVGASLFAKIAAPEGIRAVCLCSSRSQSLGLCLCRSSSLRRGSGSGSWSDTGTEHLAFMLPATADSADLRNDPFATGFERLDRRESAIGLNLDNGARFEGMGHPIATE